MNKDRGVAATRWPTKQMLKAPKIGIVANVKTSSFARTESEGASEHDLMTKACSKSHRLAEVVDNVITCPQM